ncbi:MAG: hypothetical protein QXK24_00050 [Ignisphaera sp.]
MSKEIKETDKPFILAIVSSAITVLNILIAGLGAYLHNESMTSTGFELLKFTFPLTSMAWAFYFQRSGQ